MKSCILEYIKNHPQDWEADIKSKGIIIKKKGNFVIFNYQSLGVDFFDPIVKEARGIIIDINKLKVVCWAFNKFGNWQEPYADEINWDSAKVQEKLDGSIMKLWYDADYSCEWQWSTNGMIDAADAETQGGVSYRQLVASACNYKDIDFNSLNKDYTYIFELVSPTGHVIQYPSVKLYFIGLRNTKTGEELPTELSNLFIDRPREYLLLDFDACIEYLSSCNKKSLEHEGFVVVDKNWHRIKMKTEEYIKKHKTRMFNGISKKDAIKAILSKEDLEPIYNSSLKNKMVMKYYEYEFAKLEYEIQNTIDYARAYYKEMGGVRKVLADEIEGIKYREFCFKAIDNDKSAFELLKEISIQRISSLVNNFID